MTGREGGEQMEEGKTQQWEVEKKPKKKQKVTNSLQIAAGDLQLWNIDWL